MSGTGILTWKDTDTGAYGEAPSQQPYDDIERVSDLTGLPDHADHRDVDKLVLAASSEAVKTAIVCPPTIYGLGRGPGNQRSQQVYELVKSTLKNGTPPVAGKGLTEWDNVHVHDLSALFVLLVEAALANKPDMDAKLWGEEGYFLAENGHHVWGEVSKRVGEVAFEKGYIKDKTPRTITLADANKDGGVTWGVNSKGFAKRARTYLGWLPKGRSLNDEIPYIVESEATALGIKVGHAEKVSGTQ